ncbi:RNA methyltransferase [Brevundimonas sp. 2R-24]|uniref:RNA methyltransferase n=1 Tax=Peiella sedimenti TaxID=3061083 RepID=A0ABT8SPY2_9CAUL|nr:RNA methyltransferase [Caulobacteraceae bacterium XZ-24]
MIRIDAADDPRVAAFTRIRERDLTSRDGCFIAEGEVVLTGLLQRSSFLIQAVLLAERHEQRLGAAVQAATAAPVYLAGQQTLDGIAGFPLHRGVLALCRKPEPVSAADLLGTAPADAVVACAFGLSNHDNIGGLFRNAAAFGAHAVLLDGRCGDPFYRKAIRVSAGAALTTPHAVVEDELDLIAGLKSAGFRLLALSPAGRSSLRQVRPAGRVALLLGAEGPGLSDAVMSRAETVRIEMAPGVDSLNVATAAAVALHHLSGRVEA